MKSTSVSVGVDSDGSDSDNDLVLCHESESESESDDDSHTVTIQEGTSTTSGRRVGHWSTRYADLLGQAFLARVAEKARPWK